MATCSPCCFHVAFSSCRSFFFSSSSLSFIWALVAAPFLSHSRVSPPDLHLVFLRFYWFSSLWPAFFLFVASPFLASVCWCHFFPSSSFNCNSSSNNISSSVGSCMHPPPLSFDSLDNLAFNFLLLLKRSLIALEFTLNCSKLFSLLATFCQEVALSLLPGLLSKIPSAATYFRIMWS